MTPLFFLLGCPPEAQQSNQMLSATEATVPGTYEGGGAVVATVNGNNVTADMVDVMLEQLPAQIRQQLMAAGSKEPVVQQVVDIDLLYRDAVSKGLHTNPEHQARIAMANRKVLADLALADAVDKAITDESMRQWYTDHQVQFAQPQIQLRHIIVREEAEANEVMKLLTDGADFGKVAMDKSLDPGSKAAGGTLGWFAEGDLGGPLGEAAFKAELNKPTGPIKSQFGYHVILVPEKRDQAPFEDVKEQIRQKMGEEMARKHMETLRSGATIEMKGPGGAMAGGPPPIGGQPPVAKPPAAPQGQ